MCYKWFIKEIVNFKDRKVTSNGAGHLRGHIYGYINFLVQEIIAALSLFVGTPCGLLGVPCVFCIPGIFLWTNVGERWVLWKVLVPWELSTVLQSNWIHRFFTSFSSYLFTYLFIWKRENVYIFWLLRNSQGWPRMRQELETPCTWLAGLPVLGSSSTSSVH